MRCLHLTVLLKAGKRFRRDSEASDTTDQGDQTGLCLHFKLSIPFYCNFYLHFQNSEQRIKIAIM